MGLLDWMVNMGATVPVLIMFLMGVGVFLVVLDTRKDAKIERQENRKDLRIERQDIKDLRNKYHQLDKLTYGTGIAVQARTGIKLINESVTGDGDHSLNRHIPTLQEKVK